MGDIVKFKPSMDYYYSRGIAQYEKDNFVGAIENYREAFSYVGVGDSEFRAILEVEMACCYSHLNLMSKAQLMYYKALSDSKSEAAFDSVLGLIDIFGAREDNEALGYYMDVAAKRGFSREMEFIDAATEFYSQREYRVETPPERNMLNLGKKLLEAGQFEFARQLLEVVPEDSPTYRETCSVLSALYNAGGNYEKALDYAHKAAESGDTVDTHINSLLALYKLGKEEEYREALEALGEWDTDDIGSLAKIIRTAALVGETELVKKFGKKLSVISPMVQPMISYAVALANTGELRAARKIMVMLQALEPYNATVKVFASLISRITAPSDFSLLGELPDEAESEILEKLNAVLAESDGDKAWLGAALREPDLRTGILMIFQVGSENSKRILCDVVADIPYFEQYIRDCLMDPAVPDSDKRIMLPVAIKKFRRRPVELTTRDICRPLYGKIPSRIGSGWREAYALSYGTLALFGCENFERDFDNTFESVYSALCGESNLDEVALAALIANRSEKVSALRDDECCIELFAADKDNYRTYKNMLTEIKPRAQYSRGKRSKKEGKNV